MEERQARIRDGTDFWALIPAGKKEADVKTKLIEYDDLMFSGLMLIRLLRWILEWGLLASPFNTVMYSSYPPLIEFGCRAMTNEHS